MNVNNRAFSSAPTPWGQLFAPVFGALAIMLGTTSCSSDDSGEFDGDLFVESCTLGCSNGAGGLEVGCTIVNTLLNQDIAVTFSEPIDAGTADNTTFQILDIGGGSAPPVDFSIDPTNPARLIVRPLLTFDVNGNPSFSFEASTSYSIFIPGQAQNDPGPFIESVTGRPNQSRLECTITTGTTLLDLVPGAPTVEIFMDRVVSFDDNGEPAELDLVTSGGVFDGFGTDGLENNLVNGPLELTNVWRNSQVWFRFQDIMNPSTLANPTTQQAQFIQVLIDLDGAIIDPSDQSELAGAYLVQVDTENLETLLSFTPSQAFPSAGSNPLRIVVSVPDNVVDLVGNSVEASGGGGVHSAIPELIEFDPITIIEEFAAGAGTEGSGEDAAESGGVWGGGMLAPGFGGGSGRLGELRVPSGTTLVLSTDGQEFPLAVQGGSLVPSIIGNLIDDDSDPVTPDVFPSTAFVEDGIFEFTSIVVEANGVLRFEGSNPARVFSRGVVDIQPGGLIDVSGRSPGVHDSQTLAPEALAGMDLPPQASGAGRGGFGGDRWNANQNFQNIVGNLSDGQANPDFVSLNGRFGQGIGGAEAAMGRGRPGLGSPPNAQYPVVIALPGAPDNALNQRLFFTLTDTVPELMGQTCLGTRVGAAGAGGAYALDGGVGIALSPGLDGVSTTTEFADWPFGSRNNPNDTPGGETSQIGLATPNDTNAGYTDRTLDWYVDATVDYPGFLRGGSGGGGSGTHYYRTLANPSATGAMDCDFDAAGSAVIEWHDHSGAEGGGGGGALQLVSGRRVEVNGQIDARGGNGGSPMPVADFEFGRFAMPAGGGSGGSLVIQAPVVSLGSSPARLQLDGGLGGLGIWSNSEGGAGSPGLVRIEDVANTQMHEDFAASISPFDPMDLQSLDIFSLAGGQFENIAPQRPDSISASTSCWIQPAGNFLSINFDEDSGAAPEDQGWNIDVIFQPAGQAQMVIPFRGTSTVPGFPNGFAAGTNGNSFGFDNATTMNAASPVVVRFQGARATTLLENPCDVQLSGVGSPIQGESVTPWVDHPALLNDFTPIPNIIRFVVIFDGTDNTDNGANDVPGSTLESVVGVTNLRISASPE